MNEDCNNEDYKHRNGNLGTSLLQHRQNKAAYNNTATKYVAYNGNVTHSIIVHISITNDETAQKLANSNTDV